jgi:hypothetical protein
MKNPIFDNVIDDLMIMENTYRNTDVIPKNFDFPIGVSYLNQLFIPERVVLNHPNPEELLEESNMSMGKYSHFGGTTGKSGDKSGIMSNEGGGSG